MPDPTISEQEKDCIRLLAKLFEEGITDLADPGAKLRERGLQFQPNEFLPLMRMMRDYGAIDYLFAKTDDFSEVTISPISVRLARDIEMTDRQARQPGDIVGQVNEQVRKHPVAAWIVIGFIVLTAVLTFVNQVIQLAKNFGWLKT